MTSWEFIPNKFPHYINANTNTGMTVKGHTALCNFCHT